MKNIKFFTFSLMFIMTVCMTSCMDKDWDTPNTEGVYGNNDLKKTNVITIADLKNMYKSQILTDYAYEQVTEPMQLLCVVTGNDIGGNMYSEIAVQDETGAIIIAISQGGIWGYLPLGTEILVELQGLYVGNYGLQAEIGTPYTNSSGNTYVSRMSPMRWQQHFKITGEVYRYDENCSGVDSENYVYGPITFAEGSEKTSWDLFKDAGLLGELKNVTFKEGGKTTWATPNVGSGSKSLYFVEQSSSVMVYTSNYAKFCADTIPAGKVNIRGTVKRYKSNWEFILRSIDDCDELLDK